MDVRLVSDSLDLVEMLTLSEAGFLLKRILSFAKNMAKS